MRENDQRLLDLWDDRERLAADWFHRILTIAFGGLVLLVGLLRDVPPTALSKIWLASAIAALATATACLAMAAYSSVNLVKNLAARFLQEQRQAHLEGRPMQPVFARPHPLFRWVRSASFVLLPASLLLLAAYAICRIFGW